MDMFSKFLSLTILIWTQNGGFVFILELAKLIRLEKIQNLEINCEKQICFLKCLFHEFEQLLNSKIVKNFSHFLQLMTNVGRF